MNRPFVFLENNREIISQAESLATKTRRRDLIVETATIFRFYDDRLLVIVVIRLIGIIVMHVINIEVRAHSKHRFFHCLQQWLFF